MMKSRHLVPEILDSLAHDDPQAIRSRRDLRMLHVLMGNESWMLRMLKRHQQHAKQGIGEWGAGDGAFAARLVKQFPQISINVWDLAPRPAELDARVTWHVGDLLSSKHTGNGVLLANMFLHHFEGPALQQLGRMCGDYRVLIFNEPDRHPLALLWSALLSPLVGKVTRHDMPASIRAGFAAGELVDLLGLDPIEWHVVETSTWRGARRVLAWRT